MTEIQTDIPCLPGFDRESSTYANEKRTGKKLGEYGAQGSGSTFAFGAGSSDEGLNIYKSGMSREQYKWPEP